MTHIEVLNQLKKQRAVLKTKFTKFIHFIENTDNHIKLTEIKFRTEKVEPILDEFEKIQTEIDAISNEITNDFDEFENLYYGTISRARDMVQNNTSSESNSNNNTTAQTNNIRLPKIDLSSFDGKYDKWLEFYNSFKSLVDENQDLSKVQKLHYLRSCLKGEAASIISALESTAENYDIAWKLVIDRFNNKRVIIQNHVKSIMEWPSLSKESAEDLRKLLDAITSHLRALKSLQEPVDTWSTLLIYIITSKIDRYTHKEWERSLSGTEMPTMEEFMQFLDKRCQILQVATINMNITNNTNKQLKSRHHVSQRQTFAATQRSVPCIVCKGSHKLFGCELFKKMGVKERSDKVKSARLCYNCFHSGHKSNECKWSGCKRCGKRHNTLLHIERDHDTETRDEENDSSNANTVSIKAHSALLATQVLLSTASINIKGKNGDMFQACVLLDSGSQSHFMTRKFAQVLKLPFKNIDLPVESLNQLETRVRQSINAEIFSRYNDYHENVEFLILPQICNSLPNHFIDKHVLSIPRNIHLADPKFNEPKEIDALLGVELFYDLLCVGRITIPGHQAQLCETKLGWIISGKVGNNNKSINKRNCMLTFNSLHKCLTKFWEMEELEIKTFLSEEEFQVEEHFKRNTKRDAETGRYIVRLPFNEKIKNLGESRGQTERQFYSLERKLMKNPTLKIQYVESMREAISLGHMVEISPQKIKEKHCFLPHHPVIKESSLTTKMRIVYNASATTSTGISLNECLKVGAVIQSTSFDIILRFRTHQIVMLSDIEKMYKQILLDKEDIQYQLVLWRENEIDELKTFAIPVVLFGSASAPYSATRVLNQLAEDEKIRFPQGSKALKHDCYVDDVVTGANNVEDAKKLRDELIEITKSAGFTLRKWVSNNVEVIESMSNEVSDINVLTHNNDEMKALGIQWNRLNDEITYKITEELNSKVTKRSVLADIARLYDPIGLLGPVIVHAKMLMQRLWQCKVGWDESLPHNVHTSWINLKEQLRKLNEVKFLRKTIIKNEVRIEIHGFCDASERAYGACVYVRSIDKNGTIFTNLLCAKNRIAPLKTISLPKLELCAALLLSRLIQTVLKGIGKNIDEIYLWSDSSITLQWINTQPYLLKTFVANRVSEIRDLTSTMRWRHVPSQENMADILSRGQLPKEFVENYHWKTGPEWLRKPPSEWPKIIMHLQPLYELKPTHTLTASINQNLLLQKYSTISKLTHVIAYVLRYKNNLNKRKTKLIGYLRPSEISIALMEVLKLTQKECFQNEITRLTQRNSIKPNSKLRALNPFVDNHGLIRVGGRLTNSTLSYSGKYPIILPKKHHITDLIIREQHKLHLHSGIQATLNAVRAKYWPLNGKNAVKMIIKKCVICFRAKPTDYSYFMGDLPRNRVISTRPFLNTELETYTTEIEAILNSRPITPLSEDPNDLRALTPAHFLIGDTFASLPELDLVDKPTNRLSSWQHIQYMKQHFWQRWYKDYLNQLNTRSKWQLKAPEDIKLDTMVLLKEDNTPPLQWHLGRIIELFPGKDGKTRIVAIKSRSGIYKRCITRVAPLPLE